MQITADILDLCISVLIVLSLIIGLLRGFVREAISLATWVAAIAFGVLYVKPLAAQLPFAVSSEVAKLGITFAIIFFGVLVIGSIINYLFNAAVWSIGLGGVDHFFGGIFGALRGALIVTLIVILMDLTTVPANSWWKESRLVPWFEQSAEWMKGLIPENFSEYLGKPAAVPPAEQTPPE